ncbi:MAG TPA: flagellar motor switch protein FliN [Bacteroidota bacterium]|nr:flagellar motor switch protein FliN [Bacteroidota bacterium]
MDEITASADQTPAPPAEAGGKTATADVQPAEFQSLESTPSGEKEKNIDLLLDINLPVAIELGKTNMLIKDILELQKGSLVEFDKAAGEPVDILVNGKKMAEGEVVVVDDHFAVRITTLVERSERVRNLEE